MDDRGSRRVIVDLHAGAFVPGRSLRVFVYDLSMDGCALETAAEDLPPSDTIIALHFSDGTRIIGRLMWTRGRNGGVQFTQQLPAEIVAQHGFPIARRAADDFRDKFGRAVVLPNQRFDIARQ